MKQEKTSISPKDQLVGGDEDHSVSSPPVSAML